MDEDGNPTSVNPKYVGRWVVYIAGSCLITFNSLIYFRLWVNKNNFAVSELESMHRYIFMLNI